MESRVSVCLAGEDDVELITGIKSNPALWPFEADIDADKARVRKAVLDRIRSTWYRQYIVHLDNDERTPVGEVHIHVYVGERKSWEIGYSILPAYQRQGYCFEAAAAVLHIAFEELGAHRVVAMCNARNEASYRLMEKLGMRREGVFREELPRDGAWDDQYFYAILDSEYEK